MKFKKIVSMLTVLLSLTMVISGCSSTSTSKKSSTTSLASQVSNPSNISQLSLNNKKWKYDTTNDVYYQIGISYCTKKAKKGYEELAIYVPGKYMNAKKNSDGTYTCTINTKGKVKGYSAKTSPVIFPINTAGYSSQASQTAYDYSSSSKYLKAGYVYVYAGCRGRESGAPSGATDLKSAIRYIRYNLSKIPGNTNKFVAFGHSGGGAQSSILGASGDSSLYFKYLEKIGSIMKTKSGTYISDAINYVMAWCPITNLDTANESYEWMLGQFSSSGTRASGTFTKALSNDMAKAYANYINKLGLKNGSTTLKLSKSSSGIYLSGSYYNYLIKVIQTSLNNFLKDTTFPYTTGQSATMGDMSGGSATSMSSSSSSQASSKSSSSLPSGSKPSGTPSGSKSSTTAPGASTSSQSSKTYKTAKSYIAALNKNGTWIKYNEKTNTATVLNLKGFVTNCKSATKDVGAFDSLSKSQGENMLFGTGNSKTAHFDAIMASLLKKNASKYAKLSGYKSSYATAYINALKATDSLKTSLATRMNMYNPMYYLTSYYKGYNTTKVAKYWRINTGIAQDDTASTTEMNLALALKNNKNVKNVKFTTVWEQGHTTAERTGDSTTNFIKWVNSIS